MYRNGKGDRGNIFYIFFFVQKGRLSFTSWNFQRRTQVLYTPDNQVNVVGIATIKRLGLSFGVGLKYVSVSVSVSTRMTAQNDRLNTTSSPKWWRCQRRAR